MCQFEREDNRIFRLSCSQKINVLEVRRAWIPTAQGRLEDVIDGVQMAGLCGQSSRSAVFLVHAESLRQAPGRSKEDESTGRLSVENRMLSQAECERLVTRGTQPDEHFRRAVWRGLSQNTYQRRRGTRLE